jgi:hypothetical protein
LKGFGGGHQQTDRWQRAQRGAVRNHTQLRTKAMGEATWTKRDKTTGNFSDQKKALPAKKKFKGVRRERKAG